MGRGPGGGGVEGGRGGGERRGGGEEGEAEFLGVVAEAWGLPAFGPGAVDVQFVRGVFRVLA